MAAEKNAEETWRDTFLGFLPKDYKPLVVGVDHYREGLAKALAFIRANCAKGDVIALEGSESLFKRIRAGGVAGPAVDFLKPVLEECEHLGVQVVPLDSERIERMLFRRRQKYTKKAEMIGSGLREWRWLRRTMRKKPKIIMGGVGHTGWISLAFGVEHKNLSDPQILLDNPLGAVALWKITRGGRRKFWRHKFFWPMLGRRAVTRATQRMATKLEKVPGLGGVAKRFKKRMLR